MNEVYVSMHEKVFVYIDVPFEPEWAEYSDNTYKRDKGIMHACDTQPHVCLFGQKS